MGDGDDTDSEHRDSTSTLIRFPFILVDEKRMYILVGGIIPSLEVIVKNYRIVLWEKIVKHDERGKESKKTTTYLWREKFSHHASPLTVFLFEGPRGTNLRSVN